MSLAILCSGQGLQQATTFALTGDAPEAAHLFAHARVLLGGEDPRSMVRTASPASLHQNRVGQILCTLQALSAAAILEPVRGRPAVVAGYSVGELAAWGVPGAISMTDVLDLAADRAEAMDAETIPGDGMLFVRGLSRPQLDALCARHGAAIAIVDPENAFVLGGSGSCLDALAVEARRMYATRILRLDIRVASHTSRLVGASTAFRQRLIRMTGIRLPDCAPRLLSGIDGLPVLDVETGIEKLAAQISRTVQWADCLQGCIEAGATSFLELGPGAALSRMVVSTYPGIEARSLDDFRSIDGVREWLARREADR